MADGSAQGHVHDRYAGVRTTFEGNLANGEDIGAAVVYLASREAEYVTGQTLHVNGGMAMFA